jgi:long-subunit acyl-CoA synthetase (AMP-forming)
MESKLINKDPNIDIVTLLNEWMLCRYVIPPVIEDTINRSQFIAQTFLYGENRPYTVALIVPEISEVSEISFLVARIKTRNKSL